MEYVHVVPGAGWVGEGVPQMVPTLVPGVVPGVVPGAVPNAVHGAVPGTVPGAVPGGVQGMVPGGVQGMVPGAVPTFEDRYNTYPYVTDYGAYEAMPMKPMVNAPVVQAPVYQQQEVGVPEFTYREATSAPVLPPAPEVNAQKMPEQKEMEMAAIRSKPRWETPRRRGNWVERWQDARELGEDSVPLESSSRIAASIRKFVSKIVHLNVGLPKITVEKWFHLLSEYLELSADEHVLMVALFRKYYCAQGPLVSEYDWARPQKWECVLAIACYLAVLLSEEFAGQTARELKDLLGAQFRFGTEQTEFLKAVDWKINISAEEFKAARDVFMASENSSTSEATLEKWFTGGVKRAAPATAAKKAAFVAKSRKRPLNGNENTVPVAKKMVYSDDATVPRRN